MDTKKLQKKVQDWRDWCENDEDSMNDHIRDFFNEQLTKTELFQILEIISLA